jgi:hypothetical protein
VEPTILQALSCTVKLVQHARIIDAELFDRESRWETVTL